MDEMDEWPNDCTTTQEEDSWDYIAGLVTGVIALRVALTLIVAILTTVILPFFPDYPIHTSSPSRTISAHVVRLVSTQSDYEATVQDTHGTRYAAAFGNERSLWELLTIGDTVRITIDPGGHISAISFQDWNEDLSG